MTAPKRTFDASQLIPGKSYRVLVPFRDYDGRIHPAGEQWRFLEKNFLPYEDGLSLWVEREGRRVQVRLQWRDEAQGPVVDHFSDYVAEEE